MGNYEAEHVLALQDLAKAALCSREGTKNPLVETDRLGTEVLARMHQTDETGRAVLLLNEGDALLVAYLTGPICAHLCNSKPSS